MMDSHGKVTAQAHFRAATLDYRMKITGMCFAEARKGNAEVSGSGRGGGESLLPR